MQPEPAATPAAPQSPSCPRLDRTTIARQVVDLEEARRERGVTFRAFAAENDTAKSTLQDRLRAAQDDGLPAGWQPFFASDLGMSFTLRLLVCVLVFFVLRGGCSAELAAEFFAAMYLRRYVASSPTALRRVFAQILAHTRAWGDGQFERLAKTMPLRDILLALDENFHWEWMLLVIQDVGTGFVFAEHPSATRDGETWETTVRQSLKGYKVCLCGITRDGAKGLQVCAEQLGVPAGRDIFHLQNPVCKATARPMAQRVERARKAAQERRDDLAHLRDERARAEATPRGPGRPPNWNAREAQAVAAVETADRHVATMQSEREAMQASIRALGDAHHPVDLKTGERVSAEEARERLQEAAETLCEKAVQASLGTRVIQALNGVFARLDDLAGIVAWWHQELHRRLAALSLSAQEIDWVETVWMPALYVQHRIARARDAVERAALRKLRDALHAKVLASGSPWYTWDEARRQGVQEVVQSWVRLFPRSTSGLEGHNGQDSLCQHQRHRLSEDHRKARLVVRNYVITRPDGTTAAERLFGKKPGDLIDYLCDHIKLPGRGRLGNPRPPPPLQALTG